MSHRSRTASSVTGYPRTAPKVAWTWTASWANGGIASSVIASTDKAFVIVDRASESSPAYLVALSPTTGSMLWQSDLMFPMGDSNYYTTTHPTVSADGTMVFVNVASNLTAFSASTGARLYSVIVCPFGQLASTAPLVTGNMVLSSCRDWARITANNATSGAELWTQSVFGSSNSIYGPPALITYNFRTLVAFATIGGAISAYDIMSGSQVISMNSANGGVMVSGGQARSATIVANSGSVVYSAFDVVSWSSSSPWAIVGVDVSTGQTTMRAKTPGDGYIGRGSMALGANNVLYTYANEGARVAAVSTTANNSVLWTYRLNDQVGSRAIYSSPLVSPDGSVFARDDQALGGGAKLYLLDGNTGAQLWNYTLPGAAIRNSPVIAHGGLYLGGSGSVVKLVDIAATVTPAPSASPSKMPSPSMAASMSPAAASPSQAPPSGAPLPFVAKVSTIIRINGLASTMVPFTSSLSMNLYDALNDDLLAFRYAAVPTTLYSYFDYFSVGFISSPDPTPYYDMTLEMPVRTSYQVATMLGQALAAAASPQGSAKTFVKLLAAARSITPAATNVTAQGGVTVRPTDANGNYVYNTPMPTPPALPPTRTGTVAFTLQVNGLSLSQLTPAFQTSLRIALQSGLSVALATALGQSFTMDQVTITLTSTPPSSRLLGVAARDAATFDDAAARALQSGSSLYLGVSAPVAEFIPGTAALSAQAAANSQLVSSTTVNVVGAVALSAGVTAPALSVSVGAVAGSSASVPSPAPMGPGGPTGGGGNSSPVNGAAIGGGAGGALVLIVAIALVIYFMKKPRATKGAVHGQGQGVAMVQVTINNPIGYAGQAQRV